VGSTFAFTIPVLVGASDQVPLALGDLPSTRQPLVLVVDDDPDTLWLHARAVADAGARAVRVSDASGALESMAAERPDLVLLDLGLADRDGFGVLETMRAQAATRGVPVIVITGRSVSDGDLERLRPGVAGVLRKGVLTPTELAVRIQVALAGGRMLPRATQQLVRRAVSWIEDHHAEPIVRDDIARQVAISPDYLTDCFHQEMGMSPMTYLGRCRIRHARELLETTDQSVTSVALSVGYSDVSHFTRTFHREVGVSPRVYRRSGGALAAVADHLGGEQEHPGH
jgi:AraC-like DNA-binding protein